MTNWLRSLPLYLECLVGLSHILHHDHGSYDTSTGGFQETGWRVIKISSQNFLHNQAKKDMFKLNKQYKGLFYKEHRTLKNDLARKNSYRIF